LPYLNDFCSKEYIIAYFIGETLSSLIPSAVAFFQGISKNTDSCRLVNKTNAFNLSIKTEWITTKPDPIFSVSTYFFIIFIFMCVSLISFFLVDLKFSNKLKLSKPNKSPIRFEENVKFIENNQTLDSTQSSSSVDKIEMFIFLIISFIISFFLYGVLLGLQSYSTLSYGNRAFYLSINLGKNHFRFY
jgi:hypothetical protein